MNGLPNMLNFRIIKFLSAVFTPELDITNHLKFLNFVDETLGDKLDGAPTILPLPQGAPGEIPRIQLTSSDKKWSLNISLVRTDLFYINPSISDEEMIEISDFSAISSDFFSEYQEKLDLRVQRLAFVTERILPESKTSDYIIDKFCKEEYKKEGRPFNNVKKFEIHSLKKYEWENFHLNSWVRIKSIDYESDTIIPTVLLINDLNTLSLKEDLDKTFLSNDIRKYFERIPDHLRGILLKYLS